MVAGMNDPNRKDPNYASMSVAIEEHIPDTSLVHCWARTHSMVHDVKHCLKRAKRCGVNVTLTGFKKLKGDDSLPAGIADIDIAFVFKEIHHAGTAFQGGLKRGAEKIFVPVSDDPALFVFIDAHDEHVLDIQVA